MIKLKSLLNEVSYDKSGLEKPELADRNKDKKISSWEKKVAQKIEKNLEEMTPTDEYSIGMKKYTVGRPQQYPAVCNECGSMMEGDMCNECGYMEENINNEELSRDYKNGYNDGYIDGINKKQRKDFELEEGMDHEVGMAQNLLKDIISNASELMNKIGQEEINLPGWIQDHISQAQNYINQANTGYHEL